MPADSVFDTRPVQQTVIARPRRSGKTTELIELALEGLLAGEQVFYGAATWRETMMAFDRLMQLVTERGIEVSSRKSGARMAIATSSGVVSFHSLAGRGVGRGLEVDRVCIDGIDRVSDPLETHSDLYWAVRPGGRYITTEDR